MNIALHRNLSSNDIIPYYADYMEPLIISKLDFARRVPVFFARPVEILRATAMVCLKLTIAKMTNVFNRQRNRRRAMYMYIYRILLGGIPAICDR